MLSEITLCIQTGVNHDKNGRQLRLVIV